MRAAAGFLGSFLDAFESVAPYVFTSSPPGLPPILPLPSFSAPSMTHPQHKPQAAVLRVSLVPLAPSAVKLLTARGRFHLKRLSKDTGADLDVVPSASVVRVRARRPDTAAVVVEDAKRALLGLVGSQKAEIVMDLAAVGSSWASPTATPTPSTASLSSGGGGVKRRAGARAAMQAVLGSDDSDDEGGCGGGGSGAGGSAAIAKKAAGPPSRSVSNETVRQTVKLHGCEVEFGPAPPSTSGRGGGGESGASGNRSGGTASSRAGADKQQQQQQQQQQRQALQHNNPRRQDAGRGGGAGATAAAGASVQSATTGVAAAPRNAQSRPISIRGPPGLVENARNALVAVVLGREESEISLTPGAAAALGPGNWRKIQVRCGDVGEEGGSRGHLWGGFRLSRTYTSLALGGSGGFFFSANPCLRVGCFRKKLGMALLVRAAVVRAKIAPFRGGWI